MNSITSIPWLYFTEARIENQQKSLEGTKLAFIVQNSLDYAQSDPSRAGILSSQVTGYTHEHFPLHEFQGDRVSKGVHTNPDGSVSTNQDYIVGTVWGIPVVTNSLAPHYLAHYWHLLSENDRSIAHNIILHDTGSNLKGIHYMRPGLNKWVRIELLAGTSFKTVVPYIKEEILKRGSYLDLDKVTTESTRIPAAETVEFMFNDILVVVNEHTNPELLYRDYKTASKLGVKEIGPTSVREYSEFTKRMIQEAEEKAQERAKKRVEIQMKRREEQINNLQAELATAPKYAFSMKNTENGTGEEIWNKVVENQTSPFGKRILLYAEHWGRLMQKAIGEDGTLTEEIINKAADLADYDGLSGSMYHMAVQLLSETWIYGNSFKILKK